MDKWLKTGTLQRKTSASTTEIRTTDLAAMELTWISKMIIMKCKGRLIDLFRITTRWIFSGFGFRTWNPPDPREHLNTWPPRLDIRLDAMIIKSIMKRSTQWYKTNE
ncbi:hypothetical protein AVEN_272449-1 [Araneus ventricosus]|uniref:Uncharacterized protein n=1 Tax=Araneus ventricosus TaxID=182803 RepID=A0A4Y2P3S1_ARAVE|nr:hypothetical protein AVEN_171592-1 [Araneus ventricosus]GBN45649.1 hypothetical protein AVEN_272449-1 [Araneus ventricosus]